MCHTYYDVCWWCMSKRTGGSRIEVCKEAMANLACKKETSDVTGPGLCEYHVNTVDATKQSVFVSPPNNKISQTSEANDWGIVEKPLRRLSCPKTVSTCPFRI